MILVGVQHHAVAVFQTELFSREGAACCQELLGRRAVGHGKNYVVNQPGRLPRGLAGVRRLSSGFLRAQVPSVDELLLDALPFQRLTVVRFDLEVSVAIDILQMSGDALTARGASGDLHHHFGHATDGARDLGNLCRGNVDAPL